MGKEVAIEYFSILIRNSSCKVSTAIPRNYLMHKQKEKYVQEID
jgi:hypothetical protein